jgi:hypothetical protein
MRISGCFTAFLFAVWLSSSCYCETISEQRAARFIAALGRSPVRAASPPASLPRWSWLGLESLATAPDFPDVLNEVIAWRPAPPTPKLQADNRGLGSSSRPMCSANTC